MLIQNQNPEQHARDQVDRCLSQAGWTVQDNKQIDLLVSLGVAVREYQTHVGNALCSLEEECIIEKLIEQRLSQSDVLISEAGIQLQKTEVLRQSILKQSLLREAGCTRPQGRTCLCPIRTHEDRKNQTSINKRIN